MRQVIEKLVKLDAELQRLRNVEAENYYDLMDQARARWGSNYTVSQAEFEAFLESRFTHRPTQALREGYINLSKSAEELLKSGQSRARRIAELCLERNDLEAKVRIKGDWIDYYKGKVEYYMGLAQTDRKLVAEMLAKRLADALSREKK